MGRKGILVDMHYCTGCHACEIACKQENGFGVGNWGIRINEIITEKPHSDRVHFDYLPYFTPQCNLCAERIAAGEDVKPTCVKHCGTACMRYGEIAELAREMETKPRAVLYSPL
ncbi:MAG: oxidoreductase [Clostridiales Family XIII bacterium]|jgi:anaerobic dimethyl sulfoxide reductase subunit B (iron-sulfur subunit)|nr:oxidoreductase [Clostridiales Family XIII bacterium]